MKLKKIDNYKVISTTSGDKGLSKNYSNVQLPKSDILFETLGNIDELSSSLGIIYHMTEDQDIIRLIQTKLQNISSLIATSVDSPRREGLIKITSDDILVIEELEQRLLNETVIELYVTLLKLILKLVENSGGVGGNSVWDIAIQLYFVVADALYAVNPVWVILLAVTISDCGWMPEKL